MFLFQDDGDLFKKYGYFKSENNCLSLEFEKILLEHNEE